MMMLVLGLLAAALVRDCEGQSYDARLKGGCRGCPGIEVRLLKEGLFYIHEVGVYVLNEAIPKMRIPDINENIQNGRVKVYNNRITQYRPAQTNDFRLIRPNKFRFIIEDTASVVDGKFDANVKPVGLPIKAKGRYKLVIRDLDVHADMAFNKGPGGQPVLSSPYCRAKARVEVELYDTGAFLDLILRGIRGIINNQVKNTLETKICEIIQRVVNQDANKLLKNFPLQTTMDDKLGDIGNLFGLKKGANMILKYGLTSDPQMSPAFDHATIGLEGEVSKNGRGGLPFRAKKMLGPGGRPAFPDKSSRMVYAHISDHLINSFLYSLTKEKLFKLVVSSTTFPSFAKQLRTTCFSTGFELCLGDLLTCFETYEDHEIAMTFTPTVAPAVIFKPDPLAVP